MFLCWISALTVMLLIVYPISISNGDCISYSAIKGLRGCLGHGIFVPFGTTIELKKCLECRCSIHGNLTCCWMSMDYKYPEHCTEIPDGPCRTRVVMKHNTSLRCESFDSNG